MQNFTQGSGDTVSADEAQAVLNAWTDRHQAQGVDPSVNSVQALAAGLGVSESDVQKMLEDIRVQHRSQEMAAGILQQEQKQRKRSDVSAAIGAAVALVLIGLFIAAYFMFSHRDLGTNLPPPGSSAHIGGLPDNAPPAAPNSFLSDDNNVNVVHFTDVDGTEVTIEPHGLHEQKPDGSSSVNLSGTTAVDAMQQRLTELQNELATLKEKNAGSHLDAARLSRVESDIQLYTQGLKLFSTTPAAPPTTPPPSGR